jgi:hypothetical protein
LHILFVGKVEMSSDSSPTLNAEEIDDVLFSARAGDLEAVKDFFTRPGAKQLFSQIKDEYSQATPLHMASANGHLHVVEYLIEQLGGEGLDSFLLAVNDSGNTALHWAALNGQLPIVKALCAAGGDPFLKNNAQHDAFYEAEVNEQEEVIDYLLEQYAIEPEENGDIEDGTNEEEDVVRQIDDLSVEEA